MRSNFRTYQISVDFYRQFQRLSLPAHLSSQGLRAASSVCLNLQEGSAKASPRERARFYRIALGSFREVQAILDLAATAPRDVLVLADKLGAHLYKLCKATV